MNDNYGMTDNLGLPTVPGGYGMAKIKVIGVGGGGGNAINRMILAGVSSCTFVAANTDMQALNLSRAQYKIQLGSNLTKGLGAGADPEMGARAAEESKDAIAEVLKDTDLLFIAAGMGGGTGTGAAPVIAKMAKDLNILTIAVVTKPFETFEGKTRMENANAGRKLLSEQAKGVSDILKAMAIEQSEPLEIYSDREREISQLLARSGILCTEILVYGEGDNVTVSLITFGDADGKKIASLIGKALSVPCMPAEKMPLGDEKYCCTFRKKPRYDAAFGVASLAKEGENVCGDNYSVIKIDEKTFLVALSDGMGSGEYARKLSDSSISLIESFYRTKMPAETILETVNQLLSFNREEGFVCLDIAAVNLESGEAEIIKIGSPMGFIINRDKIRLLSGETLPLGILDNMRPITAKTGLAEDDILVFLSDGVTAAFGSDTDLVAFLQTLNPRNPQSLADALVNEARRLYGDKTPDDMTALAVRMYESA